MATDPMTPTMGDHSTAPRVVIPAAYKDAATGALWVHTDLVKVQDAYAEEAHVAPIESHEQFGDVESWAHYVTTYGALSRPLTTWNSRGLYATLDYHQAAGQPGRLQWRAEQPFVRSPEWTSWMGISTGQAVPQKRAIEFLEDHGPDIVQPSETELLNLLRTLRASVSKTATTELRPDGTTSVIFAGTDGVGARGGATELPSEFTIGIPILKGHVDATGKPVLYQLKVRLRASVDDQARLALRFNIPNAERALEDVYADRVATARALLGDGFTLLRYAD